MSGLNSPQVGNYFVADDVPMSRMDAILSLRERLRSRSCEVGIVYTDLSGAKVSVLFRDMIPAERQAVGGAFVETAD
ncbi:hypothetical protein [Methylococcus sp. Mc7]|uniref:hypothetical protein n=1 Tax=Methylococcus sp. Mc7 TaxID=2860258 RepID=UPI001C527839|nr:hypothetical protein [Methylococcus sp. Mc7]QXP83012.1 hypothetical protein KW115_12485 [Methylococcus sp. Mc7]